MNSWTRRPCSTGRWVSHAMAEVLPAGASADINAAAQYGPFAAFPTALDQAMKRHEFEVRLSYEAAPSQAEGATNPRCPPRQAERRQERHADRRLPYGT